MKKEPAEQYKQIEKLELKELNKDFPKVFKKIHCPSCGDQVTADNLNLQNSVAKCGSCNVIFSIEEDLESVANKKEMKQEVFRPEGIDLFYYKEELDITVQQHLQGVDLYGLCLFPFFAVFSLLFFFDKGISIYYPIASILGSLIFAYRAMNYSKNKTYIEINDRTLSIKSRPKNFKKDKTFLANDIDQLYLKQAGDGSGYFTIHMLVNGLEGQKHEKLMTVNTISKAKYLEQEIERYLNIEDRKVPESNV